MDDRDAAISLMSNILARRDWERLREENGMAWKAWEDMSQDHRDNWVYSEREEAERIVSILVPSVLRSTAKEWRWNNVDIALRGLAGYYETGEYEEE